MVSVDEIYNNNDLTNVQKIELLKLKLNCVYSEITKIRSMYFGAYIAVIALVVSIVLFVKPEMTVFSIIVLAIGVVIAFLGYKVMFYAFGSSLDDSIKCKKEIEAKIVDLLISNNKPKK